MDNFKSAMPAPGYHTPECCVFKVDYAESIMQTSPSGGNETYDESMFDWSQAQ